MALQRTRLLTWGGRSIFEYSGSISTGTKIHFGDDFRWGVTVSGEHYSRLLREFACSKVLAGTSKTELPEGSLGDWLITNVTRQAIASYVAAILVHEGYAEKDKANIIFGYPTLVL